MGADPRPRVLGDYRGRLANLGLRKLEPRQLMKPIKINVNVTALDKTAFYRAESGAVYVSLVAWPAKESRFGETHIVRQDFPRDDERGKQAPIAGRLTLPDAPLPTASGVERMTPRSAPQPESDEDIPF